MRTLLAVCLALGAVSAPIHAQQQQQQRSVSGTWRVDFVTPLGQNWIIMTINQSGAKLTGHATDEFGEYEISGGLADDQGDGRLVGRRGRQDARDHDEGQARDRDLITGTAKLGDYAEGSRRARRTGDAVN
jgi:hypothetical protein